jgi:hypothetical protein
MKIIYFAAALALLSAPSYFAPPQHVVDTYHQGALVERDGIELLYLPNNTCHIDSSLEVTTTNYKDFVRACLNNRHLHNKINPISSN